MNSRSLLTAVACDVRGSWKELALTDIAYKIVAFVVLTPLVGILFRVLIAVSGRSVLADQDILFFFLGPVGWCCFIAVGALGLGILALEQAALMGILCAAAGQKRMGVLAALQFAVTNVRPVVQVTARILALTLLTAAPLVVAAGVVYVTLLTEHDINFYLKERPPVFWVAIGLGVALVTSLVAVLLRLVTGWFFALPLVLFESVSGRKALGVSRERATGHRWTLLLWIVGWALASTVLSALATSAVVLLGRLFVPRAAGSLWLLAFAAGATLFVWAVVNLAVNLFSTTTFAAILLNLYRHLGSQGNLDPSRLNLAEATRERTRFRLTRRRLLGAGIVGAFLAITIGAIAIRTVRLEDHTQITAHRGASAAAPENTMAAVEKAIEDGADWVEIDVQETADGEVVVFHDSDFMKLAGVKLKIWDATMADLRDIDIGSWFGAEFKDERVPTLGEILDECKGKVRVNIELKYYGHDEQLEQRVAEIVEAHEMASDIVLMSLKIGAVEKMKSIRPSWKVGLLMSVSAGDLGSIDADFLAVNAGFAKRSFIRSAHDSGRQVHVWTVNDAPTMSAMIGRGVDCLITDKPALARSVLEQRAKMSPPERLLLELAGILGVVPETGEP
jgi:glycerophosphoryl diester phosphodiesterase